MRLPRYHNPQLKPEATRIVSRKALQLEGDADDEVAQDGKVGGIGIGLEETEVEDLYAKLDKIVSKRLKPKRTLEPSEGILSGKRRKILAEGKSAGPLDHPQPVAFRLVSRSLPPRAIHLSPKPAKVKSVREPKFEDTEQEFRERASRAALSAVDLEQIERAFGMANEGKLPRLLQPTPPAQTTLAPLLLLEVPSIAPPRLPWVNPRLNAHPKPSPHELNNKEICCPIVSAAPPHGLDTRKKGGRRRGKPKNKNKLVS
ncbi:hypothetical protein BJ322DRAFT_1104586 [Thelephora terrestris]|uniref:Uncharacterized protein n=1 Tax=Thelephora terrestris TaxID=56493 RepID=A0A9P6LB99_9AGAM|nr:hypothetical protein BJ322DRAFT_1104586 [Thelephora terrestris]